MLGWTTGAALCCQCLASCYFQQVNGMVYLLEQVSEVHGSSFTSEKSTEKGWRRNIFKKYFPDLPLILKFRFPEFFLKTWTAAFPRQLLVAGSLCLSQCTSNSKTWKSTKWKVRSSHSDKHSLLWTEDKSISYFDVFKHFPLSTPKLSG